MPQGRWLEDLEVQLSFKGNQTEKRKGVQKQAKYRHNIILESQNAFAYREYPIYLEGLWGDYILNWDHRQ